MKIHCPNRRLREIAKIKQNRHVIKSDNPSSKCNMTAIERKKRGEFYLRIYSPQLKRTIGVYLPQDMGKGINLSVIVNSWFNKKGMGIYTDKNTPMRHLNLEWVTCNDVRIKR